MPDLPPTPVCAESDAPYATRLRLPELLAAAHIHDREHPDREMFLATHQECELKFGQIVLYLDAAREALSARRGAEALQRIQLLPRFVEVLVTQLDVLAHMPPAAFEAVRVDMGTASGFQSAQWREIEFICGQRKLSLIATRGLTEQERATLRARLRQPSLYEVFRQYEASHGTPPGEAQQIAGALREFDDAIGRWRERHAAVAAQLLEEDAPGTAGSSGAAYLRRVAQSRLLSGPPGRL